MRRKHKQSGVTVVTPTVTIVKPNLIKVFSYGTLSVHHTQRSIWDEIKQGVVHTLNDYELKMYANNVFYIERKLGEQVAGKLYELTEDQVKATDWYMSEEFERKTVTQKGTTFDVYVQVKEKA